MIDDKDVDSEVKELYSAFNDMSERLSRYNEQTIESLTFERNKLESVLMSIVNGVVVCDNHDKVIMVNNYAKDFWKSKKKIFCIHKFSSSATQAENSVLQIKLHSSKIPRLMMTVLRYLSILKLTEEF